MNALLKNCPYNLLLFTHTHTHTQTNPLSDTLRFTRVKWVADPLKLSPIGVTFPFGLSLIHEKVPGNDEI